MILFQQNQHTGRYSPEMPQHPPASQSPGQMFIISFAIYIEDLFIIRYFMMFVYGFELLMQIYDGKILSLM